MKYIKIVNLQLCIFKIKQIFWKKYHTKVIILLFGNKDIFNDKTKITNFSEDVKFSSLDNS